ncbi:hypothetical protein EDB84DRAFT_345265 [Lactarius hengduanensis]|nr:hypothetical protein EDB84DRAFT_345265 [Lactarius hengduanensis]
MSSTSQSPRPPLYSIFPPSYLFHRPYNCMSPSRIAQSFSVSNLDVPPPPPLHNQPCANMFQYDDADLGDAGKLLLLPSPSVRSQESISLNTPGQYNADDDANNNIRHGRILQHVPRRNETLKRVECVFPFVRWHYSHFMLDSAVPTKLLNLCAYKFEREFTHMHYSAAMGHPDDFKDNGFTALRSLSSCLCDPSNRRRI